MTITPGQQIEGGNYKATHPYMRNNFQGTEEIQKTMRAIYDMSDQIKERRP